MAAPSDKDRSALDALFWRDEILQVMYWLAGENLAEYARAPDLAVFLHGRGELIEEHLRLCADEGYLVRNRDGDGYKLSDTGRREAGRRFADAFSDMQKQGHGECTPDCDCHESGSFHDCPTHRHVH